MKSKFLRCVALVASISFVVGAFDSSVSAAGINKSCKKSGAVSTAKSKGKTVKVKCTKVGKNLRWVQVKTTSTDPLAGATVSQKNAAKSAASYLRVSSFSRSGLIEQLEFEGFSSEDAAFGVDAQKADWNVQAAKSAASYLKVSSFSRSGLIEQLLFEGFTQTQAEYGVSTTGL